MKGKKIEEIGIHVLHNIWRDWKTNFQKDRSKSKLWWGSFLIQFKHAIKFNANLNVKQFSQHPCLSVLMMPHKKLWKVFKFISK